MLLPRIERHLRRFRVAATRFGLEAIGDRGLVFDLRRGREPRERTIARVEAYMVAVERQQAPRASPPSATPTPSQFHNEGVTP